ADIALEVAFLEAWMVAASVVGCQVRLHLEGRSEETAAQGAIGHEADAELADRGEDLRLEIAGPERILRLERRDRMGAVGAPDRLGAGLREAEIAHLPRCDELRHRAYRVLDRHGAVDAMDVVEVDGVDAEAFQARVARLRDVFGPPV